MHLIATLTLLTTFAISLVLAINHWRLEDGRITQKLDSPFFMREPDNLVAFLNQISYNDYVEKSYLELLHQREQIVEHLRFSVQFGEDLVDQAKCAMDYYLMEKRMSYLKVTPGYMKRLQLPEYNKILEHAAAVNDREREPACQAAVPLGAGPCCYSHLESFQPGIMRASNLEREEDMHIGDLSGASATDLLRRFALQGLAQKPQSWKFHVLSSYYWRLRGQAQQALDCALIGVMLAPRAQRDIALLSLGTTLFRAGRLTDADVVLSAAVEHAPDVAENHIALASALAMKHEFNRSLFHFDEAERLDPSLIQSTLPVRNFIGCLENLTKKTSKMYSYVEYMKNEVKEFKKLKYQISHNHEKLVQQQIPLSARYLDDAKDDLLKRGQYCSTRTVSSDEEPKVFCDFYSDMQMRLASKDVDIDALERDLKSTSEAVIRQVSTEFQKQLNLEQLKGSKAQEPSIAAVTTTASSKSNKFKDT